jgi:hypothetical protein
MTTFYNVQSGALETQELRTKPVPILVGLFLEHYDWTVATVILCRRSA